MQGRLNTTHAVNGVKSFSLGQYSLKLMTAPFWSSGNRGKTPGTSGWFVGQRLHSHVLSDAHSEFGSGLPDKLRKVWNRFGACDGQSCAKIVPERDAQLVAGFEQRQECIAAILPGIAASSSAYLALRDESANVVFGAIGVERDLWTIEHHQQFGLVCVQPGQKPVQSNKAVAAPKYPVEAGPQGGSACRAGVALVELERLIVAPDQATHALLDGAAMLSEGVQLVHRPLRVDPAQAVLPGIERPDIELPGIERPGIERPGIVADDRGVAEQAVGLNAAPKCAPKVRLQSRSAQDWAAFSLP